MKISSILSGGGDEDAPVLLTRTGPVPIQCVASKDALVIWGRHAVDFPNTGLWPLLLGPFEDLDQLAQESLLGDSPPIDNVDVEEFLARSKADGEADEVDESAVDFDPDELILPETIQVSVATIFGVAESTTEFTGLALVPVDAATEIFLTVPFGNWNDCPTDAEHTAMLRYWHQKHGAVPLGILGDVIELFLLTPLTDCSKAKELAFECFYYAPDIVHQGVGTVKDLAQELLGQHVWFFWWD